MNKKNIDTLKENWFWMILPIIIFINYLGFGSYIPLEYTLILMILSMIGLEISYLRHQDVLVEVDE